MSLADKAKLLLIPSGYKTGKVYSVFPTDGDGDFTFSRTGEATRINQGGLIETVATQVPRIDHSGGGCPSLLLEPQRINYVPNQNVNSYGQNLADVTLSNNTSPDGTINCFRVEGTSSGLRVGIATFNLTIGNTYTGSVYVKKVSGSDTAQIVDVDFAAPQTINITTEWQRFDITRTATQTTGRIFINVNQIGDVIEVFGFQIEQGADSTSYIPTNGIIETRNADACNNAGNSDLFNDSEGVLYAQMGAEVDNGFIAISNGTTSNRISILLNKTNKTIRIICSSGGASQADTTYTSPTSISENVKLALKYKKNDFALWVNGSEVLTDNSGLTPIGLSRYDFSVNTILPFYGKCKDLRVYNTALTDAELTELTTL